MRNVAVSRPAVEAGLNLLEAGGDSADGIIAYDGRWLGGDTFVSFSKRAVKLLVAQDQTARLLTYANRGQSVPAPGRRRPANGSDAPTSLAGSSVRWRPKTDCDDRFAYAIPHHGPYPRRRSMSEADDVRATRPSRSRRPADGGCPP